MLAAVHAQVPIIRESTPERRPIPPRSTPAAPTRETPPKPKEPVYRAPRLLWKTFLRRVDGSPAALGSVVWVGGSSYLHQIDSGGRTLWATETGNQQSTPILDETRVYIGSDRNILYAMNRKTGQVAWQFKGEGNGTIHTCPTLGDGRVYFESSDNHVYALDAKAGGLKWSYERMDGSLGYSGPVFAEGGLFVAGETTAYRLDPATGEVKWKIFIGGKSLSTPAVAGGKVFLGGDGTGLAALAAADGKTLWSFKGRVANDWFGSPTLSGNTAYVTTYNRYVYALDTETGKQKWSYRLLGSALTTPALDEKRNVLYVTSATFRDNPTLTALDARTGKKLWDYRMGYVAGSPVISEGRLYVGSTNGYLYAFQLR